MFWDRLNDHWPYLVMYLPAVSTVMDYLLVFPVVGCLVLPPPLDIVESFLSHGYHQDKHQGRDISEKIADF